MTDQTPGLPVKGYKATQPAEKIEAVNRLKELEERVLRELDQIEKVPLFGDPTAVDRGWTSVARITIQTGFMQAARAIFQPERVKLDGDPS